MSARNRPLTLTDPAKPPMCSTREGARLWCNLDCCGIVCATLTWLLLMYAQYVITELVIRPWLGVSFFGVLNGIAFNSLAVLCIFVHLRAMTTDPGAVSFRAEPLHKPAVAGAGDAEAGEEGLLMDDRAQAEARRQKAARRCNTYKPERAHHCSVCRRCIVKMDHHCPWMNNCVGIGNHKFFLQFVGYTFVLCMYALVLIVLRVLTCAGLLGGGSSPEAVLLGGGDAAGGEDVDVEVASSTGGGGGGCLEGTGMVALLVAESVLFGMFTACMALDQWEVLSSGQTQIDRLKGETHAASADVHEVFGGNKRCRLDWLLPTRPVFVAETWEEVMGHRLRADASMGVELKYYTTPLEQQQQQQQSGSSRAVQASAKSSSGGSRSSGQVRERKPPPAVATAGEWERPPPAPHVPAGVPAVLSASSGGAVAPGGAPSPRVPHGSRYDL